MDYQAKFTQLVNIIDPSRTFPRDFDWDDESAIDALITELRTPAQTDDAVRANEAETRLAEKDADFALEKRLKESGVKQEDIDALKGRR